MVIYEQLDLAPLASLFGLVGLSPWYEKLYDAHVIDSQVLLSSKVQTVLKMPSIHLAVCLGHIAEFIIYNYSGYLLLPHSSNSQMWNPFLVLVFFMVGWWSESGIALLLHALVTGLFCNILVAEPKVMAKVCAFKISKLP